MTTTAVPAVVQEAITYLMGTLSRTKDVAVGMVSVMYAVESKLKTGSQGNQPTEHPGSLNPHGAYGIASWNGARQDKLAAFAAKYGLAVDDLFTQLHWVVTESANSYPQVWAAMQNPATTYEQMIVAFTDYYENPADKRNEINVATEFAKAIWDGVVVPTAGTQMPAPAPAPKVVETAAPHADVPAPLAGVVQAIEGAAGAAGPIIAAAAPVIGAVVPGAGPIMAGIGAVAGLGGAVAVPSSMVFDQNMVNAIIQAEPIIAALLTAVVKAAIAGSAQLKAA